MTCSAQDPFRVTSPTFMLQHWKQFPWSIESNQEQIAPSSSLKSTFPFPEDGVEYCQVQKQQNHLYFQAKK